jgi:hypothetical protein
MFEVQDNLARSNKRIVAVSKWRNPPTVHHLKDIYYRNWVGYDRGYRNFFNENLDVMGVAQAQKHLDWKLAANNGYSTLCIYPSSDFYFCFRESRAEKESIFRDAIRQSMIHLTNEVNFSLDWVAAVNASCCFMVGIVVISEVGFDAEIGQIRFLKNCFPKSFFERNKPTAENTNYIENTIAKAFFERAAQAENFEMRIDNLIEISRKYKFELPLSYYAFRYLDDEGNLITEREKMRLSFNKRYEQFRLETTNPAEF